MQEQAKIRQKLISIYERVTPLQQALVQLCAVIYERASLKSIYTCLHNTGLIFPDESVASAEHLAPHLNELQKLKLLDKQFRCHEAIVEVITRRLVDMRAEVPRQELLARISTAANWSHLQASGHVCLSCGKDAAGLYLQTSAGLLCESCALAEMKAAAMEEDLAARPVSEFKQAFSAGADSTARLTVLWRFEEVLRLVGREDRAEAREMMVLLVHQLGYEEPVPLARSLRVAALKAVVEQGQRILPLLLEMCQKAPSKFYANIVLAAGTIAPENPKVRRLLEEAAKDSSAEVRKAVVDAIGSIPRQTEWSKGMLKLLAHDRNQAVRDQARASAAQWWGMYLARRAASMQAEAPSASNRFQIMVRAVRLELPARLDFYSLPAHFCQRIMRELRIGIYMGVEANAYKCRNLLLTACTGTSVARSDPFVRVIMNP
ncbi:MAG: HEAT repeat domain-containing protein, partial [Desulforhabdus sp.]|nr:HEAT repeat domain-containing protein [Desulforhabdus sp.]